MNKICTSIEQSKKLIELGIDVNTADMYWDYDFGKYEDWSKVMDEMFDYTCIPAWSLSALLDLLPQSVEDEEYRRYDQHIHRDLDNTYWIEYKKGFYQSPLYDTYCSEELVDVCVEMLETLTKNGKLCLDVSFANTK